MAIKQNDFIEIEYVGKIKETGTIFDTNEAAAAKKGGFFNEKATYAPIVICIGEGDVVKGLDEALVGKEAGKELNVEVPAEKGFGKKLPNLIKMMSLAHFQKENVQPIPGLQINFGNAVGTIRSASGGRVMVDFNHPLAGRNLAYEVKIKKILTDDKEKLKGFLEFYLDTKDVSVEIHEGKAKVTTKVELPEGIRNAIKEKLAKRLPSIKETEFLKEGQVKEEKIVEKPKKEVLHKKTSKA